MRHISTKWDISAGVAALKGTCAHMARLHGATGDPPLRRHPSGFAGLARVVSGQQLSIASAAAIWRRLEARIEPFEPAAYLAMPNEESRAAGLSRAKIATLRGVAEALQDGSLDLDALAEAPDDVVHAELTTLKGIGPWTADTYLMFCLGRADAWSPGDLALQLAVKDALRLDARPGPAKMVEIAEAWRPWRGVAARLLWSYYALRKANAAAGAEMTNT
ncbi:MAG: DNA-3-methyladenine glycosylase family protein [Methyloceanibacter sp.]